MADDKTTKTPEQPVTDSGPGKEIFSLSEVQRAVRHMTITHISQANREKELKADGTISSERHAD